MADHAVIVGVAACGMTLVIVSGGIDLSVGSVVALVTVVIARVLERQGEGGYLVEAHPVVWPLIAALAGMAAGMLCGLLSAALITGLKVVPFIVTLGMMLTLRGSAKGLADNKTIAVPTNWLWELLQPISRRHVLHISPGAWIMIALAVLAAALLRYTRFGRHTFAIGSNERTARLCGVPIERTKVLIYVLSGAFIGISGLMEFSKLRIGDPTTSIGLELHVIAAVVIGGGSLAGGSGSILGSIVGAMIISVIAFGCVQIDLPNWVQEIVTGGIIVAAVALDRLRRRRLGT
jgi:ribose/xylose/arabinose/galactoside ABC-type transport system permease subunit